MVAVINSGKSLRQALLYNEQKVALGQALCLQAAHYPKAVEDLSVAQKLARLEHLAALNPRTRTHAVHLSLNFHPSEVLSPDRLREVAAAYMEGIGFAGQPYLLYQHLDAGHPHVHLVTTNIQHDGSRIELHHLAHRSQGVRRAVEQRFGLVPAQAKKRVQLPTPAQSIRYGQEPTKIAIARVLESVLPHYHYTTLSELNAVLQTYRVLADRGQEGTRLHQGRGLYYRLLNEEGRRIGAPIKASAFEGRPTLKFLEQQFQKNTVFKQEHQQWLRTTLDGVLRGSSTVSELSEGLQRQGIQTVVTGGKKGAVESLHFVDHQRKCVFLADDLGPQYHPEHLVQRSREIQAPRQAKTPQRLLAERLKETMRKEHEPNRQLLPRHAPDETKLAARLTGALREEEGPPRPLLTPKKKRKRWSHHP